MTWGPDGWKVPAKCDVEGCERKVVWAEGYRRTHQEIARCQLHKGSNTNTVAGWVS